MDTNLKHTLLAICLASALLTACGGGGGMVRSDPPPPPARPPDTPPAAPIEPCLAPLTSDCVVTSRAVMLGGRTSPHRLVVRSGTGQELILGNDDPSFDQTLGRATYTFTAGTVVEGGVLYVGHFNTLISNVQVTNANATPALLRIAGTVQGRIDNRGTTEIWGTVQGDVANVGTAQLGGRVTGSLHNDGSLYVHSTIYDNTVLPSIDGNFVQTGTGRLQVMLRPADWAFSGPLTISGRAELAGALELYPYGDAWGPYPLPGAGEHHILHAEGGVFGQFAQWTSPTLFVQGSVRYGSQDVWFDLTRASLQSVMAAGATADPMTLASAANIDAALTRADGFALAPDASVTQRRFLASAASLLHARDIARATRTLDSLSGHAHALAQDLLHEQAATSASQIDARLQDLPRGMRAGAWSAALRNEGGFGGRYATDGQASGYDQWLTPQWLVGSSVSHHQGQMQLERMGGDGRGESPTASVYAHYRRGDWHATGLVGAGRSTLQLERPIDLGAAGAHVAHSRRELAQAFVHGELGRRMTLGNGRVTPFLAVDYGELHSDAFSEQGDTGFELVAQAARNTQLSAAVGARYARDWRFAGIGWLTLGVNARYQRRLATGGDAQQAAFVGVPDAMFDLRGWSRVDGFAAMDLGLAGGFGDRWTWSADYARQFGIDAGKGGWFVGLRRDF